MFDSTFGLLVACIDRAQVEGRRIDIGRMTAEVEQLSASHTLEIRAIMQSAKQRTVVPIACPPHLKATSNNRLSRH